MALVVYDRVLQTGTANTTVSFSLSGTVTGYQSFAVVGNTNTTYYSATDGTNWETGLGTYASSGTVLTRTTVLQSSNSNAAVTFSGTVTVWIDYTASKSVYQDANGTATVPQLASSSTTSTTPVLSFNAANTSYASGSTVSGNYLQTILQNKSATAGASTNYVLSNDLGTDSTYYGEFGMNSSVFSASTPADFFSINNGVYFSGHDGDITVGSGNGYKQYFAWGTTGQSAHVINATGAIGLSTNLGTTPALSGTTGYGTSGQVLTSAGSAAAPTWTTVSAGATVTPTTTNATYYLVGSSATSGTQTIASVSVTNAVSYNASTGALTAVSHVSSSDERLKENWRDLPDTFLDDLSKVKHGSYSRIGKEWREVGVTAQSLMEVLPEAVNADDKGMLSVSYGNAALVAAIELAKEVKKLRLEIELLKAK